MITAQDPLPIDDVLPEILRSLAVGNRLVLAAPPGAGKTTRVPLALAGLLGGEGVIPGRNHRQRHDLGRRRATGAG
jgi:ATP-dependent helicase HrpB